MEESGIDMGFDLAAITADLEHREADLCSRLCHEKQNGMIGIDETNCGNKQDNGHRNNDDGWEEALSFLSTPLQDIMCYELKSRAPNTGRYVAYELTNTAHGAKLNGVLYGSRSNSFLNPSNFPMSIRRSRLLELHSSLSSCPSSVHSYFASVRVGRVRRTSSRFGSRSA